ncbi:hypothetical protein BTM409_21620 [Helicobacter pylori]
MGNISLGSPIALAFGHFTQSQSKMALIITHRMGSVRQANEIIVLDKGKLVEQGNFETLIKKQGLFSELYLKQQY